MLGLKEKLKIGCACLVVLFVGLWILGPKLPASSPNPPAVVDTSPVVTYTFEQQQDSLKPWLKDFELKNKAVNEHWKNLSILLEDPEQEGIDDKLDTIQQSLESFKGTYSSLQPPKELAAEQQKILTQVSHSMEESLLSRIKFIRLTKAYLSRQRIIHNFQSKDEKKLVELYESNALSEIKKLKETFKFE